MGGRLSTSSDKLSKIMCNKVYVPIFHDQILILFYSATKVSSYALLQNTMNENICKIEPLFFFFLNQKKPKNTWFREEL